MDQGVLVVPFAISLILLILLDARIVLGVWAFLWVGMPVLRSRFGPVSLYWCDVATLAAVFVCLRWQGNEVSRHLSRWYWALIAVHCVGLVTSVLRYEAILEPGYEVLRYGLAFSPLVLLARVAPDPKAMMWFWRGIVLAALCMAVVAVIQSRFRGLAMDLETFLYGARSRGSGSFAYRERALLFQERLRVHGMYGASTCFAGAATMVGALLMFRMSRERAGLVTRLALVAAAAAMLLTISRHGLLAWALLLLPTVLRRPGRGSVLPLIMVTTVAVLGAGDFWADRLNRGGIDEDANLSSRLIERPLELLDRIEEEPSILVGGVGLGTSHIVRPGDEGPSRMGFVSNGFALYLFFLGTGALVVVLWIIGRALWAALELHGKSRAAALGGLGATVVVIASDNYAFLHTSFPFMWSVLVALIFDRAEAPDPVADEALAEEAALAH